MMQTLPSLMLVLLGVAAAPSFSPSQQDGGEAQAPTARPRSEVAADLIAVAYYRPQWTDTGTLSSFVNEVHSPIVYITKSGQVERPMNALISKQSVILVRGSQEQVDFLMGELARFDEALRVPRAKTAEQAGEQEEIVQFEYRPRFSDAKGLFDALQTYVRSIEVVDTNGESHYMTNITYVPSHRQILVHERRGRAEEIRSLLERLDQPAPQFTVEYLVIEGSTSADSPNRPPAELAEHLARMLPFEHFTLLDTGLVHGTAREEMQVSFENNEDGIEMLLELSPASFDEQSGTLTLRRCSFRYGTQSKRRTFNTGATLTVGEFTVIGAAGSEGTLLALRLHVR